MEEKKYEKTPLFGYIPKNRIYFDDKDIFGDEQWKNVILKKIKIWYGTCGVKKGEEIPKHKIPLGIQCTYQNTATGEIKTSEQHCGELTSDDIEIKELELGLNDYFTNFHIGFDTFDSFITHLKFTTKKGKFIEFGEIKKEFEKTVILNERKEPQTLSLFSGYINNCGLTALGVVYISKKNFILVNFLGIFRLRHMMKKNEEEKIKWTNEEKLKNLPEGMRVVARLCNLPDSLFINVLKFCIF